MKRLWCCICLLLAFVISFSQDFFLLPDEFFLSKDQTLSVHLLVADEFKDPDERKYESSKTAGLWFMDGGKKTDLKPATTDSLLPLLSRKLENSGLAMVAMERKAVETQTDKAKFMERLHDEGFENIAGEVEKSDQAVFKETQSRYLKTLITIDKPAGNLHNEKLGQELEILLLQNPYKAQYGDDLVAQVLFKGKPVKRAGASVIAKMLNGNVYPVLYRTDDDGKIYFKLNRAGIWMVRMEYMQPVAGKSNEFNSYWATYTFGFK